MSFFDWSITGTPKFRGLGNYIEMFTTDDQVLKSLSISLKYAAIFVPLNMIIALVLAMLISQPVKGAKFFRTIFYIPAVISGVAVSIIFGWLLNGNYGVINYLLSLLGIDGPQWLVDPKWAIIAVIFASAFGVGSMMLIFYTDIKNIPIDLYEAAAIDGAGPARQFFSITLPMITPTILFNLITSIISSFQQVTLVMLLTNGGPMKSTYFYGLMTYNNAFKFHKLGYASANAWVMFIIILLLSALVFKSSDTWVFYESTANKNKAKKGKKAKGKEVAR
ncbi:sugar ABC transporter permease [Bifidobacterium longum]|nr:sugar ABC transporter permease [Bifidobacterium longum]MDB6597101.1 sugar ABC transporter permease [Bifidobacterium longum]MDB6603002.1 sugar ABC transporter permease [Bifidobacterium longum]MDB6605089.1 sugar ABC transporter permease [Bifidobacterium longum]MDB6607046.1 sugar ABC transporter permease [Bifidobacterium longum]MDB6608988.1 sugar ABC transporter permease [Bifidobacterium longum]